MQLDTSIYQQAKPIGIGNPLEAQTQATNIATGQMRNEAIAQQMERARTDENYQAHLRKASVFGENLEALASMPEQRRAQEYSNVRNELVKDGIIKDTDAPSDYDPNFFGTMVNRYRSTKDYLQKQLLEAQIARQKADTRRLDRMPGNTGGKGETKFQETLGKKQAEQFVKTQEAADKSQETYDMFEDALSSLIDYSKKNVGGTGVFSTLGGFKSYVDQDTELLDRKFKGIALEKMKRQFAGMSKAIDSDAERRFFLASEPSITNDDSVNASIILAGMSLTLKARAEAQAQSDWLKNHESMKDYQSPVNGRLTTVVTPSGELMLIDKSQKKKALENGYSDLDTYANSIFNKKKIPQRRNPQFGQQSAYAGGGGMQNLPSTVRMRGPDGSVRLVPANQVQAAQAAGGEVLE